MEIIILNGNPDSSGFDDKLDALASEFSCRGHNVKVISLRDKNINFCNGCFGCWLKTPGLCVHKDDMENILKQMVKSNLVIWASPLIMGGISALLKKTQDRFIPIAHPYIEIYKGECHHIHRYADNSDVALYIEPGKDDTDEDFEITRRFFERFSLNTRTVFRFAAKTDKSVKEVADEALAY